MNLDSDSEFQLASGIFFYFILTGKKLNKKKRKIIKKNPEMAVSYAVNIMKKRWFDAEVYIAKDSKSMLVYAQRIFKGKLPERLHNQMMINAMGGNAYAKDYFRWLREATNN